MGADGVYQDRGDLLFHRDAPLPRRCVVCNSSDAERIVVRLAWAPPAIWLALLVAGPVIVAIIYFAVRKTATVEIPFCSKHHRSRLSRSRLAGASAVLGGLLLAAAITFGSWWPVLAALAAFLAGAVLSIPRQNVTKMEREWIWLRGVSREYLAALDRVPGQRTAGQLPRHVSNVFD